MNPDASMFLPEVRAALSDLPVNCDLLARGRWLRRRLPADLARAASELATLRERAVGRYFCTTEPFLTRKGLEQSTHPLVAKKRADWVHESLPGASIHDATAGLGADSAAFLRIESRVVSGERDPVVARCTQLNLERSELRGCVILGDALEHAVNADIWVADPDRRVDGKRSLDPEVWSPPLSACLERAGKHRAACLKLAPALEVPHTLPGPLQQSHSWEWTSLEGELLEVALWTGDLARNLPRRAQALQADGTAEVLEGLPEPWPLFEGNDLPSPAWLVEPDPAVLRSDLVGLLARLRGFLGLHPGIGFLISPGDPGAGPFRAYRVLGACPADRKAVRRMLAERDIGPIDLKRRGVPGDPAALAKRFRGPGKERGLLALSRVRRAHWAMLLERPGS